MAVLPTFFVIGAGKAGTTSLHRYLDAHPDITMTSKKEPSCFAAADWEDRTAGYAELFEPGLAIRGEASTVYSVYPFAPETPRRVRARVPDARIVYIVRDPIERTLLHYAQDVWGPRDVGPFDKLMDDLEHPGNFSVWASRYATQLERWLAHFASEQVLVLEHSDLLDRRRATIRRVLEFVGADPDFESPTWSVKHNQTVDLRRTRPAVWRIPRVLRPGLGLTRRRPWSRLLSTPSSPPTPTPEQLARLRALLAPEADRFRALTGQPFEHWSV